MITEAQKNIIIEVLQPYNPKMIGVFGSFARNENNCDSDLDVLVEFQSDAEVGLIGLAGLEIELGQLLGRPVDIHTVKGLNPQFRDEVLNQVEVQYDQAR